MAYPYAQSHKSKEVATTYDSLFYAKDTYTNRIWGIEQEILKRITENKTITSYLDFACGTGRIIHFMESYVGASTGIDVSDRMLDEARHKVKRSHLLNVDILEHNVDHSRFLNTDLITTFRFMLNADAELRDRVLRQLAAYLSDDGLIVFNVHGNKWSLRLFYVIIDTMYKFVLSYIKRQTNLLGEPKPYQKQLSVDQVKKLINGANLRVECIYSYGFLPSLFSRIPLRNLWHKVETRLITTRFLIGTHVIAVCKKG